ncbi:MAG TPA: hypothetical protein ACFYEK_06085 [Candidatus Wunengus sp. YC60]|uniref:hypothetical protein n=1 Tax=Candidatus Wunengus sp. YC60 TaxID=3367697 RepID=UPI0040279E74
MAHKRLSLTRGNSHTYGVTFKKSDGTLYNIKNWVLKFTLKTNWDLPDSEASLQKIVTTFSDTTSGTSGSAQISLIPTDTSSLDVGIYDFDIAVTTDTANEFITVMKGKFDLEYGVTETPGTAGTAA